MAGKAKVLPQGSHSDKQIMHKKAEEHKSSTNVPGKNSNKTVSSIDKHIPVCEVIKIIKASEIKKRRRSGEAIRDLHKTIIGNEMRLVIITADDTASKSSSELCSGEIMEIKSVYPTVCIKVKIGAKTAVSIFNLK